MVVQEIKMNINIVALTDLFLEGLSRYLELRKNPMHDQCYNATCIFITVKEHRDFMLLKNLIEMLR